MKDKNAGCVLFERVVNAVRAETGKPSLVKRLWPVLLLVPGLAIPSLAVSFTPGNLMVFQADSANSNNTSFTILELSSTTANQASPVNAVSINGTNMPNALRTSGSAATPGYLSDSDDGTLLIFTGHNTNSTSGNINNVLMRGVGTLDSSGAFTLQTTYKGSSGNQTRGAATTNNTVYYVGDQGGIYTNGATSSNPSGNFRSVKSFGGTLYVFQAVTTTVAVSTVSANGAVSALPGLPPANTQMQDFYLIASGSNGPTYDVLYLLQTPSSGTTGTIYKYSLVGGSWTNNGTATNTFGGFGLCAATNGSGGAALYVTTGTGATAGNSVVKLTDAAGYNATASISSNATLYTTSGTTTMKGIAFAPLSTNVTKASAVVTLHDLSQTYDGTARIVTATSVPSDLSVLLTYDGSATPPTNAGSYAATGTVVDALYEGSTNGTLVVARAEQGISFPNPGDQLTTNVVTLSATATSGLAVAFGVVSGPAQLAGATLTFTNAGPVSVVASQVGDDNWNAAVSVTNTFNVTKAEAVVTLHDLSQTYDGTARIVTATSVPSDLSVPLTYNGSATPPTNAGSYAVTAAVSAAEALYQGEATDTLVVAKAEQGISFPNPGDQLTTNVVTLSATATSGLAVAFGVVSGPAQLAGATLTFTNAGTVSVVATQAGDDNWNAATSVTNTFSVTKAEAVVALHDLSQTYDGTAHAVTATTVPSDLSVPLTYNGSATPPTNAGSYAVTAAVSAAEALYQGEATGTLVVAKADQGISFPNPGDQLTTNVVTLSATATSGLAVAFGVVSGPAQLAGATLTFTNAGTVSVVAMQAGDDNWNAATPATNTFRVYGFYSLTIASLYGVATPPTGVYEQVEGTVLTNSITTPDTRGAMTQYVCVGWNLVGADATVASLTNVVLTLTNDAVLTWLWVTNYQFSVSAGANGETTGATNGWYAFGESVTVTGMPTMCYHFMSWTGDVPPDLTCSNPLSLTMDQPRWVLGTFAESLGATYGTPFTWLARHGFTNDMGSAEVLIGSNGMPLWQSYVADLDPTNAASLLRIASLSNLPPLTVSFDSSTGRWYALESSTNLVLSNAWLVVTGQSNVWGNGGATSLVDTNALGLRFYRIRVQLPQ